MYIDRLRSIYINLKNPESYEPLHNEWLSISWYLKSGKFVEVYIDEGKRIGNFMDYDFMDATEILMIYKDKSYYYIERVSLGIARSLDNIARSLEIYGI